MAAITSTVLSSIEKHCPKKGRMKTTRYANVSDEQDQIEYQIAEPSEWSCNCYIDAGRIHMVGPLDPPGSTLSDQHDRIVCRQGPDKTFRVQLERAYQS